MIKVGNSYKQACQKPIRKSYIVAKYGLYNKEAKSQINSINANANDISNLNKTYNETKNTDYNYISCEPNRVLLNNTFYFVKDKKSNNENERIAYWSNELSNSSGTFTSNPKITYTFSEQVSFTELTLHFQEVCSNFKVSYYYKDNLITTRIITNNENLIVETDGNDFPSSGFDKIEIEFFKTKEPYRYIKFNEIDFGVVETFEEEVIKDFNIIDELSIDSSQLSANYLNLSIVDKNGKYDILNPHNKLRALQERQEVTVYHYLSVYGKYQEIPLGTFLLKKFDYEKKTLKIEAYDDTYFMNDIYYGTKFYNNEEITNILIDLFNYFNYTNYIIDDELKGIKLTGYVPNVEFREALRLICEAGECVINKNRYGKTYIFKTYDPITQVFMKGDIKNSSPKRNLFNNRVDVVVHNYTNIVENQEVVKATYEAGTYILQFENPIIDGTLKKGEANENYSIISVGAINCTIQVNSQSEVYLVANVIKVAKSVEKVVRNANLDNNDYAITKIENPLITISNSKSVGQWKLNRSDIRLNFNTLSKPYIEVGDTCRYINEYNNGITFIPTRLEFTKSINQSIEGE